MKKTHFFLMIFANFFLLLICMFFYHLYFSYGKKDVEVLRENAHYEFINPILECNVDFKYYNPKHLQQDIEEYINQTVADTKVSEISYYARLLNNGATFGYEEEREYTPASLIKLPLAIAFLKHMSFSSLQETTTILQAPEDILERNF